MVSSMDFTMAGSILANFLSSFFSLSVAAAAPTAFEAPAASSALAYACP